MGTTQHTHLFEGKVQKKSVGSVKNISNSSALMSSHLSFIKLQNFNFEHTSSSSISYVSSLGSNLLASLSNFVLSITSFIEFEFAWNTNHQAQVWSCLNLSSFKFQVCSLFMHYHIVDVLQNRKIVPIKMILI